MLSHLCSANDFEQLTERTKSRCRGPCRIQQKALCPMDIYQGQLYLHTVVRTVDDAVRKEVEVTFQEFFIHVDTVLYQYKRGDNIRYHRRSPPYCTCTRTVGNLYRTHRLRPATSSPSLTFNEMRISYFHFIS